MRKLYLLALGILLSFQTFAQDPELYDTWYLKSYSYDLGETYYVADVNPPISPVLTIDPDLNFTGIVCNEYGGFFSYNSSNDKLVLDFFDICLCGTCTNPPASHVTLEDDYFGYFWEGAAYTYEAYNDGSGVKNLLLYSAPGFELWFTNAPLSIPNNQKKAFTLYPNPVWESLFIASEGETIESLSVYTVSGKKVMEFTENTSVLDVSGLSEGLYFLEMVTATGSDLQKFIKK
ncbi:MAG: T9SS type A sorting domain-containing protein [Altibacter sp.]|nr:T9SS type A sorting domain-containing protein [Altibacter sp.]